MESITSIIAPTTIGLLLAGFAYILPGLALVRREEWTRADPVSSSEPSLAPGRPPGGPVGLWIIGPLGIPLAIFALVFLAAAALILARPRRGSIATAIAAWRAAPALAGSLPEIAGMQASECFHAMLVP